MPLACARAVGPVASVGGRAARWCRDDLKRRSDAPTSMPTTRTAARPFTKRSKRPLREDVLALGLDPVWPGCWTGTASGRQARSSACDKRSRTRAMIWDCSGDEMAAGSRRPRRKRVISCLYRSSLSSGIISSNMAIHLFLSARTAGVTAAVCERAVCAPFPLVSRTSLQSGSGEGHDRSAAGSTPVGWERVVQRLERGARRSPAVRHVVPVSIPHPLFLRPALMAAWSNALYAGSDQPPCSGLHVAARPVVAGREALRASRFCKRP